MRAVFFDLDGTLADSSPGIVKSMQYALTSLGRLSRSQQELEEFIGAPLVDVFAKLLETETDKLPLKALQLYRDRYSRKGLFESKVYAGVPAMLAEIENGGVNLFVVTAKPKVFAERVISHLSLGKYFYRIYGSELDGARSNKTDLIRHVLERGQLTPDEAVMVGDRYHDIIGAKANGLRSVGVLWGYGSREELYCSEPDMIVDSPSSLPGALSALGLARKSHERKC